MKQFLCLVVIFIGFRSIQGQKTAAATSGVAIANVTSTPEVAKKDFCAPEAVNFMFIQKAQNATISPVDNTFNITVTLQQVFPGTLFFTTVPKPFAGRTTVSKFMQAWAVNETRWLPVAALIGNLPSGQERTFVIKFKAPPVYDNKTESLTFNASVLMHGTPSAKLAANATDMLKTLVQGRLNTMPANLTVADMKTTLTNVNIFVDSHGGIPGPEPQAGTGDKAAGIVYGGEKSATVTPTGGWAGFFDQELGRPTAFPQNFPWPE
eukprot:jgi/Botrbrau1/23684/Bobra.55_2s0064.1